MNIYDSINNLEETAASLIKEQILKCSSQKEKVIFGVVGGSSVKNVFKNLKYSVGEVPWEKVHIYLLDERFVDKDDSESNYKQIKEQLFDELIIKNIFPEKNLHPFEYISKKEDGGIKKYQDAFLKNTNLFDIILLSAANDGHIASLFPNHNSIKNDSEYFIKVENSPKPPPTRMSASKKLLTSAETSILLFWGEKQEAFDKFNDPNTSIVECPAKIAKENKNSYILTNLN